MMSELTDRDNSIILFAVHRFMVDAYARLNAAAYDRDGRYFRKGACDEFAKDAKDAEALLEKLRKAVIAADREANGWQDISTAPKDGRWILAWRNHATRAMFVRWATDYNWFENDDGDHVYDLMYWTSPPAAPKEPT